MYAAPVATTPNVPKKITHLNDTIAQAHPLDVTAFATRFLAGIWLEEGKTEASLASVSSSGTASLPSAPVTMAR